MLCQICGKNEATVHLTEIHDNKMSEIHVCERCAEDKGLHAPAAKQKFDIADLILADEPSGNLDVASADHLHALLASLAHDQHRTLVVVTHNDRLARIADRVMTLQDGRLSPSAE